MKYVHDVTYTTDRGKVAAHRPQHREYMAQLFDQGRLLLAGPFADDSGALFVFEADSNEAVSALIGKDPFAVSGVFQKSEVKPWNLVFATTSNMERSA